MTNTWFEPIEQSFHLATQAGDNVANWLWVVKHDCGFDDLRNQWLKIQMCHHNKETCACHCSSCQLFPHHPDILIQGEDQTIGVDAIRLGITQIMRKPTVSRHRIWVLVVHQAMTTAAMNALLKVLEEPPAYAKIILMTEDEHTLLATIKSRLVSWRMPMVMDVDAVYQWMSEGHPSLDHQYFNALYYASSYRPYTVKQWLDDDKVIPVLSFFQQWQSNASAIILNGMCKEDYFIYLLNGFQYLCWQSIRQGTSINRCHEAYRITQNIRSDYEGMVKLHRPLLMQQWCHQLAEV